MINKRPTLSPGTPIPFLCLARIFPDGRAVTRGVDGVEVLHEVPEQLARECNDNPLITVRIVEHDGDIGFTPIIYEWPNVDRVPSAWRNRALLHGGSSLEASAIGGATDCEKAVCQPALAQALQVLGVPLPLRLDPGHAGCVIDQSGRQLLVVDQHSERPDVEADQLAALIVAAVNAHAA